MRRFVFAALLVLSAALMAPARSRADDEFRLPGLDSDSQAYSSTLAKRHPAGATPQQRRTADLQAAAALARKDYGAAAAALEERASLGDGGAQVWLDLATSLMRKPAPDAKHALAAAWQAFGKSGAGDDEIPALLVMVDALKALDRGDQALIALQEVVQRAPANDIYRRSLAELQRTVGMVVRSVKTEGEADPPRVCVAFSVPPSGAATFVPKDWVTFDPPLADVAVTREGNQVCASGLPSGATTTVVLRRGMPGEQGLALAKEVSLPIAIPDRAPSVSFDTRMFVLPRGQAPALSLTTVNLSSVSLKLMRLTERNTENFLRDNQLGTAVESYAANRIAEEFGRVVWEGKADIPRWKRNANAKTSLPVPEALTTAGPGLYALLVQAGDGTHGDAAATQIILRTDLAPTVWRGADGLTVQVRGYDDAQVREGVKLQLLARNNDILAESSTDRQGVARFAAPLLRGEGPLAPALLHAFGTDGDFAALDLNTAAFDLSDRGVEGAAQPGPLDAFIWLDRGIYRPGETVQVMAMLRDNAGQPVDFPARVTVRRPNGQVFLQATPAREADDTIHVPVGLAAGSPSGTWTVEVKADPKGAAVGRAEFRVDAFVPDRMAVEAGPAPAVVVAGQPTSLPVTARFLYGAAAASLTGKASMRLVVNPHPFPALEGSRVGLADEAYAPEATDIAIEDTDTQGHTAVPIAIGRAPDTTHPLMATVYVTVNDPSGHGSKAVATIPVRPATPLIGIKPAFPDDSVDANADAGFDVIAVSPDGARVAMPAHLRLVRERPNWRIMRRDGVAHYETVWQDEPLETKDVAIPATGALHFAKSLDFGRYRVEVVQADGLAATSYRFRSGWAASESPDVPDRVDVSTDRKLIPAGEMARVHIAAPFAGRATLLVLSDRVHSLRAIDVAAGGTDVDVPVEASWGPGAYVAVHVFRGGSGKPGDARPNRAIGVSWVAVDPAARTLPMAIQAVEKYVPRARAAVSVRTTPGAWLTLAAVDEGILRLTNFKSPDPAPHFLGRRTLGIDIRDDWGRLIAPADGEAAMLRQGGDDGGFALPDLPQHTVILFTPPVQAGADGIAQVPLDFPDFNGQVRLMAVGWLGNRIGSASQAVIVRDAVVAEPLLPRFLAPGDQARMALLLHNLDLGPGDVSARITTEGPIAVSGASTLGATLATGQQVVAATVLKATGTGRGVIHLDVTGPQGFHIQREAAITIRPSRGAVSQVASAEIAPGADSPLSVQAASYLVGTWQANATFGAPVRYDTGALVQALVDYPLSCLEQATSRGFPLAVLPDGPVAGPDRAGRLQSAVLSVLDRQRFDGGFSLWTSGGEPEQWLTPYAMEFLIRAQQAGAAVPDQALVDGFKFVAEQSDQDPDSPAARAAQAYRLYVLALGGKGKPGLARVLAEHIDDLPTPLAKAQLGAALALAHDQPRAEAAFAEALKAPSRKYWHEDYGTSLRDAAATAMLLKESGLLPDRLARLAGALPGADLNPASLSTQEEAWAAAAAGVLGRDGRPARLSIDGKPLEPMPVVSVKLTGNAMAKNLGDRPLWQTVSLRGVPVAAPPAARSGMRIKRNFFTPSGQPLDLEQIKQNTVFVLLLEGAADDGQDHQAMLLQGLPAGWEIANRLDAGKVPGMEWLGELTATTAQPAADDRFAAVFDLTSAKEDFRVAVKLRAVTPGDFEMPGAELSDMYRPAVFARQGTNRIKVLAPE